MRYDANHIAMCLTAQPLGNAGGYSYLYLIDNTYKNRPERRYVDYAPALRAERSGLKIALSKE